MRGGEEERRGDEWGSNLRGRAGGRRGGRRGGGRGRKEDEGKGDIGRRKGK